MTLIDILYKNKKKYQNLIYKIVRRKDLVEEVFQDVATALWRNKETKVIYPNQFITVAIFHNSFNKRRVEKKYKTVYKSVDITSDRNPEIDIIKQETLNKIFLKINELPKKQREYFIRYYINEEDSKGAVPGNYESKKTNRRLALLKLLEIFKNDTYEPFYENKKVILELYEKEI